MKRAETRSFQNRTLPTPRFFVVPYPLLLFHALPYYSNGYVFLILSSKNTG